MNTYEVSDPDGDPSRCSHTRRSLREQRNATQGSRREEPLAGGLCPIHPSSLLRRPTTPVTSNDRSMNRGSPAMHVPVMKTDGILKVIVSRFLACFQSARAGRRYARVRSFGLFRRTRGATGWEQSGAGDHGRSGDESRSFRKLRRSIRASHQRPDMLAVETFD